MHETMKKTLLFTALAAVLALVSCNKEENQALPKVTKTVHFTAAAPETKALFSTPNGNTYPVLWTENDTKVDLLVNYDNNNKLTPELVRSDDNKTATFSADVEAEGDAYTFVAVSPANSVISANNTDKRFGISVPTGQASTAGSPDSKAIMLYAKSDDYKSFQSNVSMDFHHITGYFHLVFTDYAAALDGATVSSVTINADKVLAGRIFFFPGDGHMEENGTSGSGTVTATTSSLDNVWMGVAPVDLSNEAMTIVVNTDKGTITKSIQFGANAVLSSGKIAKLQISLAGSTLVAPVQYNLVTDKSQLHIGDKIIIVAANSNVAISSTQNDNNRGQASITKGEGVILDPSDAVEVFELEDGIKPGEFALKATSAEKPGYLYAAYEDANTGNYMRTKDALDKYGSWSISIADKQNGVDDTDKDDYTKYVATIQAESSARGLMLYNQASSLFSSYSTTSSLLKSKVSYLHIYRLDKAADTTPRFKATMPDADGENQVTISASAKDNIEVYVFGNSSWTASVTSGATLSETAGTGNTILTLSVPENTSTTDTQDYTITVSTTASVTPASYVFTITQSKKIDAGAELVVVYSLEPTGNDGTQNTFAGNSDADMGGIVWNITGNGLTGEAFWRIGGKSLNGVNRGFYSKTALPHEVTKVVVSHGTVDSGCTVNSFTFTVHSSAADAASGANPIATLSGTVVANGNTTFEKPDDTSWFGYYYRFMYNFTVTSSKNKRLEFTGAQFWGYSAE